MEIENFYSKIQERVLQILNDKTEIELCIKHKLVLEEILEHLEQLKQKIVKLKEQASQSERLKSAFLNNISHEIRTPLNAILGFSDLICLPEKTEKQKKIYSEIIKDSCNNLLNVITNTLEMSLINTGIVTIEKKPYALSDILNDIQIDFEYKATKKGIQFKIENNFNDPSQLICTDRYKLLSILKQLIENGIKFTNQGIVKLHCGKVENSFLFAISDTGIGISAQKQEIIFDSFTQTDTGLNRNFGGVGIGLALVKNYVEFLNGKIELTSIENKGSTFFLTLPF